jgi:hypothetical protein
MTGIPAILDPAAYDAWLDPATPAGYVKQLLGRNLDRTLEFCFATSPQRLLQNRKMRRPGTGGRIQPLLATD